MIPVKNQIWIVRCFVKEIDNFKQAEEVFKSFCENKLGGTSRQIGRDS